MHCIDMFRRAGTAAAVGFALSLAGCGSTPLDTAPSPSAGGDPPSCNPALSVQPALNLGPPAALQSMHEVRVQAAMRIVDANPDGTYGDRPPDVLLAIPVLEIELNANGSVCDIRVSRYPGQALDTTQLAIDAVHRAAPFGDVSHLPKPWVFTEVFLFRDDRRFKPRTLDD